MTVFLVDISWNRADAMIAILGNIMSSVLVILANKRAVAKDGFDFMLVLTGLQFYVAFFLGFVLLAMGVLQYKLVKSYTSLLRITVASLASIVFMNMNLKFNSVGFYQISKLCCIPVGLLLENVFNMKKQQLTPLIIACLALITIGMVLVTEREVKYNHWGLVFMGLGVLSTSIAQIWFAPLQRELGLNSLQMLFHTSPFMALFSFVLTPLCEDTDKLMKMTFTKNIAYDLLLSSAMAFLLNVTNYKVLELTSPLTYQILGHVKTVLIIISGIIIFDDLPSVRVRVGLFLCTVGMVLYGWEVNNNSAKGGSTAVLAQGKHKS